MSTPQEQPMSLQCSSCKLESPFVEAFHRVGGKRVYCPPCWEKRRHAPQRTLWLLLFGMIGVGLACIILGPDSGIAGWILINTILSIVLMEILVLPHEVGHAVAAWLLGLRVFGITLGTGKTIWRIRVHGVPLDVKAIPMGGITIFGHPNMSFFRTRHFLTILAGPVVNAVLLGATLLLIPLDNLYPFDLLPDRLLLGQDFALANGLLLVRSLWPCNVSAAGFQVDSDGRQLCVTPFLSADSIQSRHAVYFFLEGQSCSEQKRYATAAEWHRQGLAHYPKDLTNRLGLGYALFQMKDFGEARRQWLDLLQRPDIQPGSRFLLLNNVAIVNVLIAGADPGAFEHEYAEMPLPNDLLAEADGFSYEAFHNAPWVTSLKGTRGCVLVEQGEIEAGMRLLEDAMHEHEVVGHRAYCACYIALAEARLGHRKESIRFLEYARNLDPDCIALAVVESSIERKNYAGGK